VVGNRGAVSTNLERLQAAGIAVETPVREPQRSIVDELSEGRSTP
jgi:hypothetical protein